MATAPQSSSTSKRPSSSMWKPVELGIKKSSLLKKATNLKQRIKKVNFAQKPANMADSKSKSEAIQRANEVKASLPVESPCFVKPMLPSHVSGGFWLGLPSKFCKDYMPKEDETVVLVDEIGEEVNTKFIADKTGLSGGWRGFAIAHKLVEGDAVVFQLLHHWKFKVYIIRVTGDQNTMKMESTKSQNPEDMDVEDLEIPEHPSDQHTMKTESMKSQIPENMNTIDSEIPKHVQVKYHDLCQSQKTLLHETLIKGLNAKLAVGIILETVTISDAIRSCTLNNTREDFDTWDKTLKGFEELGMKVGFLRARIGSLVRLREESNGFLEKSKGILEVKKNELGKAEDEMRVIFEKLCGVKGLIKNLNDEIGSLKVKGKNLELGFCEVASAPW